MDNTIDTGDPWDLGEQEHEQAPQSGGINQLAESTGLFPKKQPLTEEAAEAPIEEPSPTEAPAEAAVEPDAELPEPALPDPIAPVEEAAAEADDAIESALEELEAAAPEGHVDEVDHVLQELEAAATAEGESFELIPPSAVDEISPMYETYTPNLAAEPVAEPVDDVVESEIEAVIPPGPPEGGMDQFGLVDPEPLAHAPEPEPAMPEPMGAVPAAEPVFEEPVVEEPVLDESIAREPVVADPFVEETVIEEPAAEDPVVEAPVMEAPVMEEPAFEVDELTDPVEIEFGKPNVPEGSELPTGKATQTVTGETMTRPALLTTSEVAGAKIAPVDMVMAVASVDSPAEVADAMAAVLEELRDRCAEAGGDVVTGVKTEISSAGSVIMVTAAGTAVSLL